MFFYADIKPAKEGATLLQKDIVTIPHEIHYWGRFVSNIQWKKVWILSSRCLITNKSQDVCFKHLHLQQKIIEKSEK